MADLLSVGLDVGTTTTQLILSTLQVENKASGFAVPNMAITNRTVAYRSPVIFTPLKRDQLVDGDAIATWVENQYRQAGVKREQVDTGAIIITGETSRKENADTVLSALSDFAGDFVVATAGPDLESVLAAKGAGAVSASLEEEWDILHMDIGGGTSNLALIRQGKVIRTGCLNVGGRLIKFDETGRITYRSPVLEGLTDLQVGQYPAELQIESLAKILTNALEMAAGLRPVTDLLSHLWTKECGPVWEIPEKPPILSFSGGVADCIKTTFEGRRFGDMGPPLGQAIRQSLLCKGRYLLGQETIRATVIGAGCHSTQLSGSTVYCQGINLPLKNLPVVRFSYEEQAREDLPDLIQERYRRADSTQVVLALPGYPSPTYEAVSALAKKIAAATDGKDLYLCLENDMAKALGHCLGLHTPAPCLCIDGLKLTEGSYLDVGTPVGPALPVVIKTLILSKEG